MVVVRARRMDAVSRTLRFAVMYRDAGNCPFAGSLDRTAGTHGDAMATACSTPWQPLRLWGSQSKVNE